MNMCKCGHGRSSHVYTTCHCTVCACPNYDPVEEEVSAPLPPTAEQMSIARFNALANEIRELTEAVCRARKSSDTVWELDSKFIESVKDCLAVFSSDLDGIKERGREHSMAISALCDSQTDLHKKIDGIATILAGPLKLDKDADKDAALLADINESIAREKRMETTLHVIAKSMHLLSDKGLIQELQRNGYEIRTKPRAVAKKKAAPLVGKKGTGRKG